MERGQIITLGYVTSTAEPWPKIPLPKYLEDKVESMDKEMNTDTIVMNFELI